MRRPASTPASRRVPPATRRSDHAPASRPDRSRRFHSFRASTAIHRPSGDHRGELKLTPASEMSVTGSLAYGRHAKRRQLAAVGALDSAHDSGAVGRDVRIGGPRAARETRLGAAVAIDGIQVGLKAYLVDDFDLVEDQSRACCRDLLSEIAVRHPSLTPIAHVERKQRRKSVRVHDRVVDAAVAVETRRRDVEPVACQPDCCRREPWCVAARRRFELLPQLTEGLLEDAPERQRTEVRQLASTGVGQSSSVDSVPYLAARNS